jgi:hypothetical protein
VIPSPLGQMIFLFLFYFIKNTNKTEFIKKTPRRSISASLGISKQTITEYYKIFRKIMKNRNSYLKKIGGKNDIVEIDESKSCKRKYNKGHQVKGTWIVGGISRKTKKYL